MSAYARDPSSVKAPAAWLERSPSTGAEPMARRMDEWVDRDSSWGARWKSSPLATPIWDRVLLDPMRDILARPGKSFRANLVRTTFALVDARGSAPNQLAAALEILHAGSLIVDDIADASTERRGAPSVHRIYGVPRALNAGNYMYFWALELLSELDLPPAASVILQRKANRTMLDCHRGQALDLGLSVGAIARSDLSRAAEEISTLKTGALMSLAAFAGALAAGGSTAQLTAAEKFGMRLGVTLQKLDDLGNLTSKHAPQKRFEDLRAGRVTWPWAWAAATLDPASFADLERRSEGIRRDHASGSSPRPGAAVREWSERVDRNDPARAPDSTGLANLAADLLMCAGLHRRTEIRVELGRTLSDLVIVFGDVPAIRTLADEMERLEASYG